MNNCNRKYKKNKKDNKQYCVEVNLMIILFIITRTEINKVEKVIIK